MTSAHVRRLESRVARTAARFVDQAERVGAGVADLPTLKLPWYAIRNQAAVDEPAESATVFIFDEIGGSFGVSADDFVQDLEEITAPTIQVRINSPGGNLFDAIAMYNALNHHPARIVVYVDSLAASAASIVAMAGDEIVMMPGSQMMIHDAGMVSDGNAADLAKASTFLDRQSANIADIYRMRAGGDLADWRELMIAETWAFAAEAVDLRLADRVEDPPAAPEVEPADPDVTNRMRRSFDLSAFRYAGRAAAPAPNRVGAAGTRQRRARTSVTDRRAGGPMDARSAAVARRAACTVGGRANRAPTPDAAPTGAARMLEFPGQLRAKLVDFKGRQMHRLEGYASVFGCPYEMWDDFGPYQESVNAHALDGSLAAGPDVAFLVNHKGITMARTTNGTLTLAADDHGLRIVAYLNPDRQDVRDLVSAVDDELVTEMSFAFMLEKGVWNDDFTVFDMVEVDINRGDTSAVNYGASPYTSIAARSREIIKDLDRMPAGAARAALQRLQSRKDVVGMPVLSADVMAALGDRIGTAVQAVLEEIRTDTVVPDEPVPTDDAQPEEPAPPADVLPSSHDGRSLDATAAWLAAIEAEKIGAHP